MTGGAMAGMFEDGIIHTPGKEIKEERVKYRYKRKTFAIDEDIDIPPDAKILKSYMDYACNHHEYENVKKDTITIQWLEPIHK